MDEEEVGEGEEGAAAGSAASGGSFSCSAVQNHMSSPFGGFTSASAAASGGLADGLAAL